MAADTPKVGDKGTEPPLVTVPSPTEKEDETVATKQSAMTETLPMPFNPDALLDSSVKMQEMASKNMELMVQAAQGAMSHLLACQEATTNLMRDRIRKNQETARACFGLDNPMGILHVGADHQRAMLEDYAGYFRRLADITVNSVNQHALPLQKRAEEQLGEAARKAA